MPRCWIENFINSNLATLHTGDATLNFEQLLILSINNALQNSGVDVTAADTILILSSTKGNISLLETAEVNASTKEQIGLYSSAKKIAGFLSWPIRR